VQSLLAAIGPLVCLSCSGVFAKDDGRALGDDLGRFRIAAVLDESTCGANALGAPENWEFDVILSRDASRLFWNTNAAAIEGNVDDRGRFSFETQNVINAGSSEDPRNSCTIVRKDRANGAFDDPKTARAFDGSLEYSFSPQGTADCSDAMAENGLLTLPCSMSYRLAAEWVSAR
jgi:hypothetical protein